MLRQHSVLYEENLLLKEISLKAQMFLLSFKKLCILCKARLHERFYLSLIDN